MLTVLRLQHTLITKAVILLTLITSAELQHALLQTQCYSRHCLFQRYNRRWLNVAVLLQTLVTAAMLLQTLNTAAVLQWKLFTAATLQHTHFTAAILLHIQFTAAKLLQNVYFCGITADAGYCCSVAENTV